MKDATEAKWQKISELEAEVRHEEEALRTKKQVVNDLRAEVGAVPAYSAQELEPILRGLTPGLSLFHVLPLAACVKRVLEQRDACGLGPAGVEDIYGTLVRGGFDFTVVSGKGQREQLRGLAITLARNPKWFARAQEGKWSLKGSRQAQRESL